MNSAVLEFFQKSVHGDLVKDKSVLEIGSRNINGVVTEYVKSFEPAKYVGVDIIKDDNVDLVLDAKYLDQHFAENTFDLVYSTELMEHVVDWKKVLHNKKTLLKPGGYLLITTRSKGFNYHACPHDYWRYEVSDFENVFADFEIIHLEKDPESPGVFLFAKKPEKFKEVDISNYSLYSIVKWKRLQLIDEKDVTKWDIKKNILYYDIRYRLANLFPRKLKYWVKSLLLGTNYDYLKKL